MVAEIEFFGHRRDAARAARKRLDQRLFNKCFCVSCCHSCPGGEMSIPRRQLHFAVRQTLGQVPIKPIELPDK